MYKERGYNVRARQFACCLVKEHAAVKFAKTDVSAVAKHVWQKHHQIWTSNPSGYLLEKIIYRDVACWSPGSYNNNTTV